MLAPAMWAAALLFLAVAGDLGSISAKRLLGRLDRRLNKISRFSPHRMIVSPPRPALSSR
jgi:hypothetical protein